MADFNLRVGQGAQRSFDNPTLRSGQESRAEGFASATPEARREVAHRSKFAAGMTPDEAQSIQARYTNLIGGRHT